MTSRHPNTQHKSVIDADGLQSLIGVLRDEGYQVIAPRASDDAMVLGQVNGIEDLPVGVRDEQDGGHYRLVPGAGRALFESGPGPQGWKRYLYPPEERLWRARRHGESFTIEEDSQSTDKYAFLGVRACDLRAMEVQDKVFDREPQGDPRYVARRKNAFVVAVNCARAGGTCFCVSMASGPRAKDGFDVSLTELIDDDRHVFLAEAGSKKGVELLERIDRRPASDTEMSRADAIVSQTAESMGREMIADAEHVLARNLESDHWETVADRCLTCGNCTLVCPTCFCTTVEDVTDLSGAIAERWRKWDSCYSMDFSYIHGGSIRREGAARYRQWIAHKLSFWHEQFGISGCVGCGRCITWCPVGIDITEEARTLRDGEKDL